MFRSISEFTGGDPALRAKLNEMVRAINSTIQIMGGTFVSVDHALGTSGLVVDVKIDQVLSRIPKQYSLLVEVKLTPAAAGAGSDGTNSSPATWVYDVVDYDNNSVSYGVTISPKGARPNGSRTQATYGLAKIIAGTPSCRIVWCDEVEATVVGCTTP